MVRLAHEHAVPVISYGTGSSPRATCRRAGRRQHRPVAMTSIVGLNPEDLTVTVQAGVTREQLNREIRDSGPVLPIDPGANASLGGMAATRASGTNAVRYGTMRENVLGSRSSPRDAARSSAPARGAGEKSSAGYDRRACSSAAKGTLGVITEVTLKLYPLPEAVSAAICHFASIAAR